MALILQNTKVCLWIGQDAFCGSLAVFFVQRKQRLLKVHRSDSVVETGGAVQNLSDHMSLTVFLSTCQHVHVICRCKDDPVKMHPGAALGSYLSSGSEGLLTGGEGKVCGYFCLLSHRSLLHS